MRKNRKNYTLKVLNGSRQADRVQTHSLRRFLARLRTINWQNKGVKTYIRVSYGKRLDVWGKCSTFYNDGWYDNKQDLWQAFNAFNEEE